MSESQYNKIEFIIIIIISLIVACIIGFNIINIIENKNIDTFINILNILNPFQSEETIKEKETENNTNKIKLNDVVLPDSKLSETRTNMSNTSQIDPYELNDIDNKIVKENFGSLPIRPNTYDNEPYKSDAQNKGPTVAGLISEKTAEDLLAQPSLYDKVQDPNFNNLNNIPVLISPDPPGPNSVREDSPSYYANRVKLIDNPESPLLKLYESNFEKLAQQASSCNLRSREAPPQINGTFDGFNAYNDLRTDSFANVSAIGKGMLTPYTSFPVPS